MEREGGRRERGREESKGGKKARRGSGFSTNSDFQALGFQVRQGGGALAPSGRGEGRATPDMALFMWDA